MTGPNKLISKYNFRIRHYFLIIVGGGFDSLHTVPLAISITYSGFWLVNILLGKFDILSKKEMKMIETRFFDEKQQKCQKSIC